MGTQDETTDLAGLHITSDGICYKYEFDVIVANLDRLWDEVTTGTEELKSRVETLAKACAGYDRVLGEKGLREELAGQVKFGPSKHSMFVQLGQNEYIWTAEIRPYLTGHYSRDYHLALLDKEQINKAIDLKLLQPDSTREELKALKRRLEDEDAEYADGRSPGPELVATISLEIDAPEDIRLRLTRLIQDIELLDKESITVKRPVDPKEAVAMAEARYEKKLEKKIREAAKAQISWRKNLPIGWAATCDKGTFAEIGTLVSKFGVAFNDLRQQVETENPPPKSVKKHRRQAISDGVAIASVASLLDELNTSKPIDASLFDSFGNNPRKSKLAAKLKKPKAKAKNKR